MSYDKKWFGYKNCTQSVKIATMAIPKRFPIRAKSMQKMLKMYYKFGSNDAINTGQCKLLTVDN